MTSTQNPRRRSLRPGRKVAAGGIVAALIALGMWLATLIPGLGLGLGGGLGPGDPSGSKTPAPEQKAKPEPQPIDPSGVVTVKVEADRYLVLQTADGKHTDRPATLNEIVALAKKAPGDKSGMKVRILVGRTPAAPLDRLKKALLAAGIDPNAIVQRNAWE
jgi:hypothetical protein